MMNNKGYVLLELIMSISMVFIIMLQLFSITLDMYKKTIILSNQNNLENNIYNLYREIGYDFINYNILNVEKNGNSYIFTYYRNDESDTVIGTLTYSDNKILYTDKIGSKNISSYELNSSNNIKINTDKINIVTIKNKDKSKNIILKLTININEHDYEFICSNKIGSVSV